MKTLAVVATIALELALDAPIDGWLGQQPVGRYQLPPNAPAVQAPRPSGVTPYLIVPPGADRSIACVVTEIHGVQIISCDK
jgi:hypothetical protein